ncbi:O-acyltransferase like protein [Nilaparvata lugens]|uniref:O-acyltransferase like protein n=1 Tax=Nilaparvata lugens TaxID=108931 RepID=UPI00193E8758|nr:O-acyltransferase like protein [Nilaparvata lugens]
MLVSHNLDSFKPTMVKQRSCILQFVIALTTCICMVMSSSAHPSRVHADSPTFEGNPLLEGVIIPPAIEFWGNSTRTFIHTSTGFPDIPLSTTYQQCFSDIDFAIQSFFDGALWALQMEDASSKVQSGILEGNIVDLGQYDECLKIKTDRFKGQHCLVPIVAKINESTPFHLPQDLLNGEFILTSSLCVPSTCSAEAVEQVLNFMLIDFNKNSIVENSGFGFSVRMKDEDCHQKQNHPFSLSVIIVIILCASLFSLTIVCGVIDWYLTRTYDRVPDSALVSFVHIFSAWRNCKRLMHVESGGDSLNCINGARFLSIGWVALGHRYKYTAQLPLVNLLILPKVVKTYTAMIMLNATLSVDVFFLIGGLLNAYVYMKLPARSHNLKMTIVGYIHRYLRLTPAYALMIAVTATWLYHLGDGPLWDRLVGSAQKDCQEEWLPGILYINNYYHSNNYCMMQSWYLAADMQMFFLSPILLYPLWKWPKVGFSIGGFLIALSVAMPFYVAFSESIKAPIPVSRNERKVEREMETLYLPTHTKTVSYVIGILLGYFISLIKTNQIEWRLKRSHLVIGWTISILFAIGSMFGGHPLFQIDHEYNRWESSLYIGFYRLFWGLAMSWILLICVTGYGGFIADFLNCKLFVVLGRLTYGIYLTHNAVIIYKMGRMRQPVFFDIYDQYQQYFGEFLISMVCGFILTLMVESPAQILEKKIIRKPSGQSSSDDKFHRTRSGKSAATLESAIPIPRPRVDSRSGKFRI